MIEVIYLEEEAGEHPRTLRILDRFPRAVVIKCKHYKEVFNPNNQNFRLQKKRPALIIARQKGRLVHPIPESYGVGGKHNFYFSHLLNCPYDCRYCFLQGMYPSAHYVLFVNFEDFEKEIASTARSFDEPCWFFSGYDSDSLALESISGFAQCILDFFRERENAWLELRTKSVATKVLEETEPLENSVVAFSFTPEKTSEQTEVGVPSVSTRIRAMSRLSEMGWKIGLRIDPLIDCPDFRQRYEELFSQIFAAVERERIHSVSLGTFRMPAPFFKKIQRMYPEESLWSARFSNQKGMISYQIDTEERLKSTCHEVLSAYLEEEKIFTCR